MSHHEHIIRGGLRSLARELNKPQWQESRFVILLDEHEFELCLPLLIHLVPPLQEAEFVEVPVGEECKTIEVATQVWQTLLEGNHDRNTTLVALGGGCITDLAGFVASGYMRGIRHINIPTTLIAMTDAAIGGKTAINLGNVKNVVGHFYPAELTVVDPIFLHTLPPTEIDSGMAEMIKTAAVSSPSLYQELLAVTTPSKQHITSVIRIKQAIVKSDPTDKGIRHILNFGHTFGHAIEAYSHKKKKPIPHGLAVGIGMKVAMYLSTKKTGLDTSVYNAYSMWIKQLTPLPFYGLKDIEALLDLMRHDKKNNNNQLQCVLLRAIGEAIIDVPISDNEVRDAFLNTCK